MMWESKLYLRLFFSDLAVVVIATTTAQLLRFGLQTESDSIKNSPRDVFMSYTLASLSIIVVWLLALYFLNTWKKEILGAGSEEYRRVIRATVGVFALIAIISYLGNLQIARGYVLVALPFGLVGLLASRWAWRQWLKNNRRLGTFLTPSVIIGSVKSADEVSMQLISNREAGYLVLGCFLSGSQPPASESQQVLLPSSRVPILGGFGDAVKVMRELGANTLVVANSDDLSPHAVRSLGWKLRPGEETLVLAPSLLDVSGPRMHISPVAGVPLLRVETPQLSGLSRFIKRIFDLVFSLLITVLLSPLFIFVSVLIKKSSPGPVFFKQERIGLNKKPFTMYKFRTMRNGAHLEFEQLVEQSSAENRQAGNEIQFKLQNDPRITKIGAFLRRFSIDELPQILNVLKGQMSLVGPRPHVISEVNNYEEHVLRRLLVKPGLTGQWQVSGRSTLSWEESVRADLLYVENWSLTLDFIILFKTLKAVFKGTGAF